MHWRRKWQPTPVLPGEFQGRRSLVGCCRWGCTELDTTEATWQQHIYTSIYIMEYYSAVKYKEILPYVTTWIDFAGIMLSETNQQTKTNTI